MGGHPRNIILLTADAFGVLPPIARLTADQAMYHFLSGYTAKVAGTERGVTEPKADLQHLLRRAVHAAAPTVYAQAARRAHRAARRAGVAGQHRLDGRPVRRRQAHEDRAHPRDGPRRAVAARSTTSATEPDPIFGLDVPHSCPGVPRRGAEPAQHLDAASTPTTRAGAQARADVPRELQDASRRTLAADVTAAGHVQRLRRWVITELNRASEVRLRICALSIYRMSPAPRPSIVLRT